MARCPQCNTFVPYGDGVVEIEEEEINDDGEIIGSVRVVLDCGNCGTELKEATLEVDVQTEHTCDQDTCEACEGEGKFDKECGKCGGSGEVRRPGGEDPDSGEEKEPCPECDGEGTTEEECPDCAGSGIAEREGDLYEIVSSEAEFSSRQETEDRNGKPIKSSRYMKTYYGADLTFTIHCNRCEEDIDVTTTAEEMASAFDELN